MISLRKTEETAAVQPHSESKNKPSKEPISRSLLRFAVEKEQPNLARVKLLLCNNSNRQVQWMLNCDDNAIKIEPMRSGRIEMLETGEVNLIWQRSEDIAKWTDAPSPKMQLLIKLIAVETGEEVIDTFVKFKATIKPEAECTINDLPIHKMILQSKLISEQSENNENNSKIGTDAKRAPSEGLLQNPETLFWLIIFLCCFLGAVILRSITDDNLRSH